MAGAAKSSGEDGWECMGRFLKAISVISSEIRPEEACAKVIAESCKLLQCDRSTLFFVDPEANELIRSITGSDFIPGQGLQPATSFPLAAVPAGLEGLGASLSSVDMLGGIDEHGIPLLAECVSGVACCVSSN